MTRTRRAVLSTAAAAVIAGCSSSDAGTTSEENAAPTGTTGAPTGSPSATPVPVDTTTDSGVRITRDLTFRETPERTLELDLYRPAGDGPHPFLVWAHGGGWMTGDKGQRPMFPAMAEAGIAVADIQYRLAGEARYPAAVRDTVAGVKWVRDAAETYGLDSDRGALGGYSAGAHLTALVAVAPEVETFQPREFLPDVPADVSAFVGYSGPYDFTQGGAGENALVAGFFGADASDETLAEGSPTTHVDGSDPPAMLVHGTDDGIVPSRSTTVFAETLRGAGVGVDVITGDGADHGMIDDPEWRGTTMPAQRSFLRSELGVV